MRPLATLVLVGLGAIVVALATFERSHSQPPPPDSHLQTPHSQLQTSLPFRTFVTSLSADSAAGTSALPAPTPTPTPNSQLPTPTPTPTPVGACGFRSDVRALVDARAADVNRDPATGYVNGLLALERPAGLGSASPRDLTSEGRVFELGAWLRGAIRTQGGGIELLVSASPGGPLLRARFPSIECAVGASAADRAAMEAARVAFIQRCGVPPAGTWRPLGGPVTLVGVPAWGERRPSGIDGAPSGIELAPVLDFAMPEGTTCDPTQLPGPVPGFGQPGGPTPTATPSASLEMLVHVDPVRVNRGAQVTVTIIVQEPPGAGGTPRPGPAGILCSYQAFDVALNPLASGGPSPTGPDGTVSWTFTVPQWAALDTASRENGRVTPTCQGISTRGSARLEIVG